MTGGKIFFADEAHFQADAELTGKWVLNSERVLGDSTSPRYGGKASNYSAACLETGEAEWMELEGNSNSGTSEAFLSQLGQRHSGQLNVIWDNAVARGKGVLGHPKAPTSRLLERRWEYRPPRFGGCGNQHPADPDFPVPKPSRPQQPLQPLRRCCKNRALGVVPAMGRPTPRFRTERRHSRMWSSLSNCPVRSLC